MLSLPTDPSARACNCTACMTAAGVPAGAAALLAPAYGVEALLTFDEMRWNYGSPLGTPASPSYSFSPTAPAYYQPGDPERNNYVPFTEAQKQGARRALAEFSEVANLTFIENPPTAVGHINFGTALFDPAIQAYTYFPFLALGYDGYQEQGDVWLNNYWSNNLDHTAGSYGFMTLLHEIGDAVGLKHSFDSTLGPVLPANEENRRYTVMSYLAAPGSIAEPSTLMLYDIAVLQLLYGANYSTRSGNTAYAWANGALTVETIWDGGGIDTIDASNQTGGVRIDLREGAFSSLGPASSIIGIAYGAVIENATGGNGNDALQGNHTANRLNGGAGSDMLTGGGGADRFVFADRGDGIDIITDFAKGQDRIVLDRANFGLSGTGSLASLGVGFALNGATLGAGPAIIYDFTSQYVMWDPDGQGAQVATIFGKVYTASSESSMPLGNLAGWNSTATADFNGDGIEDLVWRNETTGQNILWRMGDGGGVVATGDLGTFTGWEIGALGDFNADGTADLLWSNTSTGRNFIWLLDDGQPMRSYFGGEIPGWTLAASADLNGDGATDLLWRNIASGENYLWLFDDGQPYSTYWLGTIPGWQIGGAGDVDGDGTDDLLWRHQTTREAYLWLMDDGQPRASWSLGVRGDWEIVGLADFDGSGTDDILWHHASGGQHAISYMTGGLPTGERVIFAARSEEVGGIGDYTGDGIADIVMTDPDWNFRMIDLGAPLLRAEDFVVDNENDDMVTAGATSSFYSVVTGWTINVEDPVFVPG